MKLKELLAELNGLNPEAEVRIMTSHDEGDDVVDWEIKCVHDHWTLEKEHDMVSIEVDLDQRPDWSHALVGIE